MAQVQKGDLEAARASLETGHHMDPGNKSFQTWIKKCGDASAASAAAPAAASQIGAHDALLRGLFAAHGDQVYPLVETVFEFLKRDTDFFDRNGALAEDMIRETPRTPHKEEGKQAIQKQTTEEQHSLCSCGKPLLAQTACPYFLSTPSYLEKHPLTIQSILVTASGTFFSADDLAKKYAGAPKLSSLSQSAPGAPAPPHPSGGMMDMPVVVSASAKQALEKAIKVQCTRSLHPPLQERNRNFPLPRWRDVCLLGAHTHMQCLPKTTGML